MERVAPDPTFRERVSLLKDSTIAIRLAPYFQDWTGSSPDPQVLRGLIGVARRVGANPAHLLVVVEHESQFNPQAQFGDVGGSTKFNPRAAQGLLQFTSATAKGLGTTPEAIHKMTGLQQVKLVEKYLVARSRERLGGGPLDSLDKVALATFYPAYMGKDPDTLFPARVEEGNPGIRTPADYIRLVTGDLPMAELERIGDGGGGEQLGEVASPAPVLDTPGILSLLQNADINYTAKKLGRVETQANSLRVILREFNAAGVPLGITLAAMANAFVESKLDPNIVAGHRPWAFSTVEEAVSAPLKVLSPGKPPEDSRGLFQLNARGAGKGMTAAARHDPTQNTLKILQEYSGSFGDALRKEHAAGASVQRLAYLWAHDIERPDPSHLTEGSSRLVTQKDFLGPFATLVNLGQAAKRAEQAAEKMIEVPKKVLESVKPVVVGGFGVASAVIFGGALLFWLRSRRKGG